MQNLFITENDVFDVKLFVAQDENDLIYCDNTEEGAKTLLAGQELDIEKYVITFRKPSFGDLKKLADELMFPEDATAATRFDINPIEVKLHTISFFIKDWNFVDGDGGKIPTTKANISKLNPVIASAIGIQLDNWLNNNNPETLNNKDQSESNS